MIADVVVFVVQMLHTIIKTKNFPYSMYHFKFRWKNILYFAFESPRMNKSCMDLN